MDSTGFIFSGIAGIFTIIGAFAIGIPMVAFGQAMSVFREIALNTRKEGQKYHTEYRAFDSLATIISAIGWIIVIGGSAIGLISVISFMF